MPILIGTDGSQKMSKSLGNYVGLGEDPLTMYSKLEKVPDALIQQYFELLTNLPLESLPANPRDCQKLLAVDVVTQYHGAEAAKNAQSAALSLISGGNTVTDAVPEFSLDNIQFPAKLFYIVSACGLCKSSSEARKQMTNGAVRLEGDRITDQNTTFNTPEELQGKVLQVGKKHFIRLVIGPIN
jgi:tyrosyl-tRNA synthetase